MNRLLLAVLAASIGLSACSKKEEAAAPAPASTAPAAQPIAAPASQSATTPHTGKVLQALQAGSYTYAEVQSPNGEKVWIAGGPIQIKAGDDVQWGDFAVMQNFKSKALDRTFDQILFVNSWGPVGGAAAQVAPHGNMSAHPAAGAPAAASAPAQAQAQAPQAADSGSQGKVKSVAAAAGYTYVEVDLGNGSSVWVAAPETALKAGDTVRWSGNMVMRNFTAKSLGRTFDQIIFANAIAVVR